MTVNSVVIVDDDRLVRESLVELVGELGCRSRCATCGSEAMAVLGQADCDLLVSDIDMPDFTGFELVRRLAEIRLTPAVILMSARADAALAAEAERIGASALLGKPIAVPLFTDSVRRALHL